MLSLWPSYCFINDWYCLDQTSSSSSSVPCSSLMAHLSDLPNVCWPEISCHSLSTTITVSVKNGPKSADQLSSLIDSISLVSCVDKLGNYLSDLGWPQNSQCLAAVNHANIIVLCARKYEIFSRHLCTLDQRPDTEGHSHQTWRYVPTMFWSHFVQLKLQFCKASVWRDIKFVHKLVMNKLMCWIPWWNGYVGPSPDHNPDPQVHGSKNWFNIFRDQFIVNNGH